MLPVKLEKEDVKRLDVLVRLGIYKNRSQAIRAMLREGLDRKMAEVPMVDLSGTGVAVDLMEQLASRGMEVIRITSRKSAAQIVAEGRERL